ncbi:hypothetical protein GOP47_0000496 [Adiantum capillus-veneris]|uniref:Strictosidine synthase conserved region domain-containing protein n=1 Tax=Adiantum capillus-veneris TaxID=13818 RepID=A0A9D4VF90_ADICA|nr:hypothetical protein GOP47_0000496 [Adiantum capillus-veneris]
MHTRYAYVVGLVVALAAAARWRALTRDSPIDPHPTQLPIPPPPTGVYAPNAHLHKLHRLADGALPNPEDLVVSSDGRFLYAACSDGWIKQIHLSSGHVRNWTLVPGSGRPLGLALGLHGEVLACEPSLGLLNITEGKVTTLSDDVCGMKFKFADALDVSREDGSIYFTDASTKFGYGESNLDVLEGRPNGRLLKYDPSTGTTTVLATGLHFPNGVAVSKDNSFLVVCETSKVRCGRLWLKGSQKGILESFIDNLPGYPDNIHRTERGTFWIGLVSGRSLLIETVMNFPFVKHLFATQQGMKFLDVASRMAKVLEVSDQGEPLRYMEDPNGKAIGFVTCALEHENHLYLGGLASDFVGRLSLEQI